MSDRPNLTTSILVEDFNDFYWLKEELLDFCRREGLSGSGAKIDISKRIGHFLRTGEKLSPKRRKKRGAMPENFTRETIIGSGWRCSQGIRNFFEAEIGSSFHFNQTMRDFIKNEEGETLQDAIEAWHEEKRAPKIRTEIEPQFEYMRHMRDYFDKNPQGTRKEALKAWNEKKARRKKTNST